MEPLLCPNCEQPLQPDFEFCTHCGMSFKSAYDQKRLSRRPAHSLAVCSYADTHKITDAVFGSPPANPPPRYPTVAELQAALDLACTPEQKDLLIGYFSLDGLPKAGIGDQARQSGRSYSSARKQFKRALESLSAPLSSTLNVPNQSTPSTN